MASAWAAARKRSGFVARPGIVSDWNFCSELQDAALKNEPFKAAGGTSTAESVSQSRGRAERATSPTAHVPPCAWG